MVFSECGAGHKGSLYKHCLVALIRFNPRIQLPWAGEGFGEGSQGGYKPGRATPNAHHLLRCSFKVVVFVTEHLAGIFKKKKKMISEKMQMTEENELQMAPDSQRVPPRPPSWVLRQHLSCPSNQLTH